VLPFLPKVISTQLGGGGLGNQLFDYAAARSLADRHGSDLVIDASVLAGSVDRPFCLDAFAVRGTVRVGAPATRPSLARRALRRLREDVFAPSVVRSRDEVTYFEGFAHLPARCRIRGHMLSPRFFASNEDRIREDVQIIDSNVLASPRVLHWRPRLDRDDSIAVHVRRGDMLLPAHAHLRLDGLDRYMSDALERVTAAVPGGRFFVFSDDPEWCRSAPLLAGLRHEIVSVEASTKATILEDFELMRTCHHIIMPNSAFSWWAAFARREVGYTILPPQWMPSGELTSAEMRLSGWLEP
jgi:hypothetical protein